MDNLTVAERSARMARIRGRDTKPELVVRKLLFSLGYRYRIHVQGLPGRPDIAFPSLKKAIFVHGCFWHQHGCGKYKQPASRLDFWLPKLDLNVRRDRRKLRQLNRAGWQYRIVWECQLCCQAALARRLSAFLG
jgi:DNA mismatch endonuclease, patch repair protein